MQCVAGANDWGNNFAASVATRALTYRQALLLGATCELLGVVLLGPLTGPSMVQELEDWTQLKDRPDLVLYGLMWTAIVVGAWLLLCSRLSLPISTYQTVGTTHTAVLLQLCCMLCLYIGRRVVVSAGAGIGTIAGRAEASRMHDIVFMELLVRAACYTFSHLSQSVSPCKSAPMTLPGLSPGVALPNHGHDG